MAVGIFVVVVLAVVAQPELLPLAARAAPGLLTSFCAPLVRQFPAMVGPGATVVAFLIPNISSAGQNASQTLQSLTPVVPLYRILTAAELQEARAGEPLPQTIDSSLADVFLFRDALPGDPADWILAGLAVTPAD